MLVNQCGCKNGPNFFAKWKWEDKRSALFWDKASRFWDKNWLYFRLKVGMCLLWSPLNGQSAGRTGA